MPHVEAGGLRKKGGGTIAAAPFRIHSKNTGLRR
jgi:hypothetical protein